MNVSRKPTLAGASRYHEEEAEEEPGSSKGFVFDDDTQIAGSVPIQLGKLSSFVEQTLPSPSHSESQRDSGHGSVPLADPFGIDDGNDDGGKKESNAGFVPTSSPSSSHKRQSEIDGTPTSEKRRARNDDENGDNIGVVEHMLCDIKKQLSVYGQKIEELDKKVDGMALSEHASPHYDLSMDSIPPPDADDSTLNQWMSNQGTYPRLVREALYMFPGGTRHDRSSVMERLISMAYGYREGSSQSRCLLSKFLAKLRQLKQYIRDVVAHPLLKHNTVMYIGIQKEAEDHPEHAAAVWMHHPPSVVDPVVGAAVIGKIRGVLTKGTPILVQNNVPFDNWCLYIVSINLISMKRNDSANDNDHDVYSTVASAIFPMTRFNNLCSRITNIRRSV